MADLCHLEHKYDDAGDNYRRSLAILEKTVGQDHPEAGRVLDDMARFEAAQGNVTAADALFLHSVSNLQHEFQCLFPGMSERDRLQFLQRMQDRFSVYYSFVLRHADHPEVAAHAYDFALWQKGLVVTSISALRDRLGRDSDQNTQELWGH
jgi:tetratricopeptide repeat protein